jgi:hypothetical protein
MAALQPHSSDDDLSPAVDVAANWYLMRAAIANPGISHASYDLIQPGDEYPEAVNSSTAWNFDEQLRSYGEMKVLTTVGLGSVGHHFVSNLVPILSSTPSSATYPSALQSQIDSQYPRRVLLSRDFTTSRIDLISLFDEEDNSVTLREVRPHQPVLRSASEETANQLITESCDSFSVVGWERLGSRLKQLEVDAEEDRDSNSSGIAVSSLRNFLSFLRENQDLKLPAISLTEDGNLYASWKDGPSRVFSIHFIRDNEVRFVIFRPNDVHPGATIRLSGSATTDVIMSLAEKHGVRDWAAK